MTRRRLAVHALAWAVLSLGAPAARAADAVPLVTYQVRAGDTLIGIAQTHLLDPRQWRDLQRLNRVRDPRRMPVGLPLNIPLPMLRTEPASATLTAVSGDTRTGDRAAVVGQTLAEGEDLVTGADGQATVRLVDGTVLRLRAAGRVRVDESRRTSIGNATRSGVRLDRGRVEIEATPVRGGLPGFRIHTPQGVMAVRGTEFRVEADGGQSRSEVLEGAVGVSGAATPAERRVVAGHGTVVDASGAVAEPVPLAAAPDLSRLPARHERPLVRLQLPAQAGAQGYRVQIGRDARFESLLIDLRVPGPEVRLAGLDDGRYPMRVRAVGERGLEGRDAVTVLVLKARPEPPLPRAPAPAAVIVGSSATFGWAGSSEAQRYRLQIARVDVPAADPFAAPLRDVRDLTALVHTADGLAPGSYVWRLASVRADGDQGPWGDPIGFVMRAPPPQPAPPAPPSVGDNGVNFFWQGERGQRFDFQVARDTAFTQLILQRELQATQIELPLPGDGRFYVRLRARDPDGFVGPWSATQHFDVIPCVRDSSQACVRVSSGTLQRP